MIIKKSWLKKIIVYLPTLSEQKKSIVKDYISELKNISLHFNLIVRPHPKEKDLNKDKFNLLKRSKLKLDLHDGRDTSQLISAADLIITDGGSSLLESIYLKKRTLIHNWQNKVDLKTIEDRLKNKSRLDVIIIKGMPKKENLNDINYIKKALNDKLLINKIKKLRAKYFIVKDKVLAENIIKKNFLIWKIIGTNITIFFFLLQNLLLLLNIVKNI